MNKKSDNVSLEPIIHLGFPKCGSTFLQEIVFPSLEKTRYICDSDAANILAETEFSDLPDDLLFFKNCGQRYCYSSEKLLHFLHSPLISRKSYYRRRNCLENIKRIFQNKARLIIQIRRQDKIVQSYFQYSAPSFITRPMDIFIDYPADCVGREAVMLHNKIGYVYFESFDYYSAIEFLGKENVFVLALEELSLRPNKYFDRLSEIFDEDLHHLDKSGDDMVNVSPSVRTRYPAALNFLKPVVRKIGADKLAKRLLARKIELTPGEARDILRSYEYGNRKIQEIFDLPLDEYGYFKP